MRLLGIGRGDEPRGARLDAEAIEEHALRHGSPSARAGGLGRGGEIGEIDVRGEIGRAGLGQDVVPAVAPHRLQGVAAGAGPIAVIDEERGAALARKTRRQVARQGPRRRPRLAHRAGFRVAQRLGGGRIGKGQRAIGKCDDALAPVVSAAHELADRERVQKFIGDEQHRAARHVRQIIVPPGRRAQRLFLRRAQHRAALDQMQPRGAREVRHKPRGAERVLHQRAAARPELDQQNRIGRAHPLPQIDAPQADQLAEHLADLWRGDEIAARAQRIARRVIAPARMEQRLLHEGCDAERPRGGDAPGEMRHQLGCALGHAYHTRPMPKRSTGSDKSCPIVAPS